MALKTRMWSAGKLVVLAGALLATYVLFAAAAMRVALRAREVVVPNLTGRSVNEASSVLADSGLGLRVEDARRIDPHIEAGRVVQQEPMPGLSTRVQRSVKVWLSAGPRASKVPALVGQTEQAATLRLQTEQLELAELAEIRSTGYPSGAIVAQEPPPDTESPQVHLLVNRGERDASFVMPDLIGVSAAHAADLLRSRGFRVAVVADHPYPGVPGGFVLRQRPQAGYQVTPGEPISLEVSR